VKTSINQTEFNCYVSGFWRGGGGGVGGGGGGGAEKTVGK